MPGDDGFVPWRGRRRLGSRGRGRGRLRGAFVHHELEPDGKLAPRAGTRDLRALGPLRRSRPRRRGPRSSLLTHPLPKPCQRAVAKKAHGYGIARSAQGAVGSSKPCVGLLNRSGGPRFVAGLGAKSLRGERQADRNEQFLLPWEQRTGRSRGAACAFWVPQSIESQRLASRRQPGPAEGSGCSDQDWQGFSRCTPPELLDSSLP